MQSEAESEGAPGSSQECHQPEQSRKFGRYNRVANYGCRRFQFERLRFIEYTTARQTRPIQVPGCA